LVVHYNQGEVVDTSKPSDPVRPGRHAMKKVNYPESWLADTNYFQGPVKYERNR
jgi:hypothetical protein